MVKAILFDFDGTLADTAPGIVLTMQAAFREMGLPVPDDEAVRQTIGLPLAECVKVLGNLSDEKALEGADVYRKYFPTVELEYIKMFPGVAQTLKECASLGIRMAICTSRGHNSLERILTRNGLWECFETAVTSSDKLPPKPAPDMVLALLERMGLRADEAVVVGDTTFDILMGAGAGCRTIAVTYGNHSSEQLKTARPDFLASSFPEVKEICIPLTR